MISIIVNKKAENIMSFVINSHALPQDRDFVSSPALVGEAFDMICSNVSVLSQSVIIGLDEVLKLNCNYEMKDGYLKVDLNGFTEEEIKMSQVLLLTFEKSIESLILSLEQMYGKEKSREYITFKKEEV